MTGSVLDQRLQWIRLFAKITALLLYVLAFSISNNTPFLNYYLWGMLILRAISTVTVFCVVKQLKGDFEEKLELFEGVEQLDSE